MKKSFFGKCKTFLSNADKPSLIISCIGITVVIGVAGYAAVLKAHLHVTPAPHIAAVESVTPSIAATPSIKPTPTPTPTPSATPKSTPTPAPVKVAPAQPVVHYVTQTAPQSNVNSLQPHTSAPSTPNTSPSPSPSTAPGTSSAPATTAVSYTSSNWAGYLASGSTYTAVSGSWTVPSPTGNGTSTTADTAWVGIGGVTTNDLIQAGTLDSVSASGQVTISAFYEILPAPAQLAANLTVSPGDVVSASVTETGANTWQIIISDITTGQSIGKNLSYASSLSSAEWIEEDPTDGNTGQQIPFDHFGSVPFTSGSTVTNGASATIAGAGGLPITMMSGGTPVATPSALSGGSFTVTRNN